MDTIPDLYEYKFYFMIQPMGPPLKLCITMIETNLEKAREKIILKLQGTQSNLKKEFTHISCWDIYKWYDLNTKVKPCIFSTSSELTFGDGFIILSHTTISLRDYINTCTPEQKNITDMLVNMF